MTLTPMVWRNRSFRLLFGAQVVSLLGSGVTTVALALYAYQITGGPSATAVVGNALTLRILAFLLFSQPAGVLADRMDRRRMLVAADLLRFALLTIFPFVTSIWHIYVLVFAINAVTAFFTPTFEATLPDLVGPDAYVQALSWSRVASDVEAVVAPALAAGLVALVGVRWLFWFDAGTYLVSALLVRAVSLPQPAGSSEAWSFAKMTDELTHGTRILLREPSLRQALLVSVAEATAGACAIVVTVGYVHDVLGRGNTTVALLMATVGLGSTTAALLLGRTTGRYETGAHEAAVLHGRRHRWSRLALLAGGGLLGASLLFTGLAPSSIPFALLWLLNGSGQALVAIPSSTLLAEHTQKVERGRAYAAHFALTHAFWLASYPAVGHAAARWGAASTFTSAGCICLLATLLAMVAGRGLARDHSH